MSTTPKRSLFFEGAVMRPERSKRIPRNATALRGERAREDAPTAKRMRRVFEEVYRTVVETQGKKHAAAMEEFERNVTDANSLFRYAKFDARGIVIAYHWLRKEEEEERARDPRRT